MMSRLQKEKALQFRQFHQGPPTLVLPNAWDAASAYLFERVGFRAIATTSSGVAAALGYADGQISRAMMLEVIEHITRVVECPVTVDIEAGRENTVDELLQMIRAVIMAGAVGINIEDSKEQVEEGVLVDVAFQVELIKTLKELALSMDIPFVVNARTDMYLLPTGDDVDRFDQAVQRANAYRQAGADCLFVIGVRDADIIRKLVQAIKGPLNIHATRTTPSIGELAQLGVARVSFGSLMMHAVLGQLRHLCRELLEQETYTSMSDGAMPEAEFRSLFTTPQRSVPGA
jgi:2-methylisocitrate lyase-like PEP mutase family enzyme